MHRLADSDEPRRRVRYYNEDKLRNPEQVSARLRVGLQAQRHRRVVKALPPELTRKEFRRSCHRSQEELARSLGVAQARLSRIERCSNPRLKLLQAYVEALGGTLHLLVRFPDRDLRIKL